MSNITQLITDHLDIWTAADTEKKSGRGRASGNANSVYGIKKLRELILELAVRGKLVPQDPSDEPASELLKRVKDEKAKLVANGKIKKDKPQAAISENDKPFIAPNGWSWVRLSEVLLKITDGTHRSPTNVSTGDFKYISAKNIKPWGLDLSDITYVTKDVHDEIYSRCDPTLGDILYIKDGATTGIATINTLEEPFSMLSSVALLKPSIGTDNHFLLKAMTAPFFYAEMRSEMTGVAITRVTLAKLNYAIIPLPPLAEQHRIVAKVDELMALCDQLEAQHNNAADAHEQLVSHLLSTLTQSQDAEDFNANWQRIATHFDTLFTTESSIDALKQTLLQLAVMGKLVPQDPKDEPASELLKRIQVEKVKLVAEGKIKKDKPQAIISLDERPFELRMGWDYVRLGDIIKISSGDGLTAAQMSESGTIPVYGGNGVNGYHDKANIYKRTLVIGRVGFYCGSIHITPEHAWATDNAFITEFSEENIYCDFLYWLLRITNLKENENATAQPVISGRKVYPIVVALPPLNEQHRIVVKINKLMTLCEQLKSRITNARLSQQKIADVLIEMAVEQ